MGKTKVEVPPLFCTSEHHPEGYPGFSVVIRVTLRPGSDHPSADVFVRVRWPDGRVWDWSKPCAAPQLHTLLGIMMTFDPGGQVMTCLEKQLLSRDVGGSLIAKSVEGFARFLRFVDAARAAYRAALVGVVEQYHNHLFRDLPVKEHADQLRAFGEPLQLPGN
jgi:hypothetical protein